MSSKRPREKTKSVRFESKKRKENENLAPPQKHFERRQQKRPRMDRPNEDEEDDIDDWVGDEDMNGDIPAEHKLLDAKRSRRLKRHGIFDSESKDEETHLDSETSLMSEMKNGKSDIKIEPFNMREESSDGTGYFEGDTYIFRRGKDKEEESDSWFDSLNDSMKNPNTQFKRGEVSKNVEDNLESMDNWPMNDLYAKIVSLLTNSETVLGALVRYGNLIKRAKNGKQNSSETSFKISQKALDDLTSASNALLLKGDADIYQKSREDILKHVSSKQSSISDNIQQNLSKKASGGNTKWEYRGNQDGKVHGPYSSQDMLNWINAGYFVGPQAVQVRMIKSSEGPTQPPKASLKEELLSDLMDDDDDDDVDKKEDPNSMTRGEWVLSDKVDFKAHLL